MGRCRLSIISNLELFVKESSLKEDFIIRQSKIEQIGRLLLSIQELYCFRFRIPVCSYAIESLKRDNNLAD